MQKLAQLCPLRISYSIDQGSAMTGIKIQANDKAKRVVWAGQAAAAVKSASNCIKLDSLTSPSVRSCLKLSFPMEESGL